MMSDYLIKIANKWISYKIWLVDNVGVSNDAMHVHFALMMMIVAAVVLRRRPDSIWCWLIVFAAEIFNEYADVKGGAIGEDTLNASMHDIYNTMFWPTVILITGRFLFPRRKQQTEIETPQSSDLADQSFEQAPSV